METFKEITAGLAKNKSLILLISLLLLIVIFPYFENTITGSILLVLLFTSILLSGIYAVSYNLRYVAAGLLLAVPTFVTGWSNLFAPSSNTAIAEIVFIIIFLAYTIIVLLKHIFSDAEVSMDELYGAISVYIMVGIAFGLLYSLIEIVSPGSFFPERDVTDMSSLIYFSFIALSTVGFGDLTEITASARPIVIIETIIGVIYVAVLIGALVNASSHLKKRTGKGGKDNYDEEITPHTIFQDRPWLLVLAAVMLNFATSVMMMTIKLPFYMDTWASSFSVIIGGLGIGIIAGIIYNVLMAATYWGTSSLIWMLSSILVACTTYYFHKKEWIDIRTPARLITVGLVTGLLNAILSLLIIHTLNLPPYQGTMEVYSLMLKATGDALTASITEQVIVEITDKTIALIIAATAAYFIQDILKKSMNENTNDN